ncbi:hypothetical protein [Laceyella putida]|uniref:Lipoprotein n=1 Tax=Laceyella putida TaxID=110101 RepID=A0ABW2RJD3_9BACL
MNQRLRQVIFTLALTLPLMLAGCGGYEALDGAEKTGLDYVIEIHTAGKRDLDKLSRLTGRTKTKAGIAHIKPFLKDEGTVWVGSTGTEDKDKKAVYLYFDPEMTTDAVVTGVYVEKRGHAWIYAGDIALTQSFAKVDFSEAEDKPELKKLKVAEWEKVTIEKNEKK